MVAEGLITETQLKQALAEQKGKTEKLGSTLARLNFITEEQLIAFLSRQYGIPSITLNNLEVDAETLRLVPAPIARKYEVLPVKRIGGTLTLAMADPTGPGAKVGALILLAIVLAAAEVNALVGTTGPGKKMLSTLNGTFWGGFILTAILYFVLAGMMR